MNFEHISYQEKETDGGFIEINEVNENKLINNEKIEYTIVFLADECVNKGDIIRCYKEDKKINSIENSSFIGIEKTEKNITKNNEEILLNLINVSSQERCKLIHKIIYEQGDGFLIFFSYEDKESFISVKLWYDNIIKYKKDLNNIPIFIVGINKKHSVKELRNLTEKILGEKLGSKHFEFKNYNDKDIKRINSVINDLVYLLYKSKKNNIK